jgi:hypothetical protein
MRDPQALTLRTAREHSPVQNPPAPITKLTRATQVASAPSPVNNGKSLDVIVQGKRHTFDSYACAIHALAHTCEHCSCRVIGRGIEAGGGIFCCAHVANLFKASRKARDRVA